MTDTIAEMTFEAAFEALRETLERLERGDLPLQEAITLYERGMMLAKHCNDQLDRAELRLKQLAPTGQLEPLDDA